MFALLLLSWWYGRGWLWVNRQSVNYLKTIDEVFSVATLLKTLFAPWKQIQSATTFQNFIQSSIDNFISRFIGATVRLGMLLTALVLSLLVVFLGLIVAIIWPLIPLLLVALPVISIKMGGA
ncbi:hypothetical protein KY385_01040 [Candidatus Parcubacteria bacterium]|nr:hypothetical protein [Candidatus Parcubacteria bacterium]